jgi:hypothetical protein
VNLPLIRPRQFLLASLMSSLLALGATSAWADLVLPDGSTIPEVHVSEGEDEPTPGDVMRTRNEKVFADTIQKLKDKGFSEVGNQLPLPAIDQGEHKVELKKVAWDKVTNLRLLGHANEPLKLLMVLTDGFRQDTRDEVQQVIQIIKEINQDAGMPPHRLRLKLHLILSSPKELNKLDLSAEDYREFVEVNKYFASGDVWMQDWGEIGAVMVEGAHKERTVVFDSNRGRGLAELPERLARNWNGHYIKGPPGRGAGNYGGNIEVTPDDYLVIGNTSTPAIREMFSKMGYMNRMKVLRTDWLLVGHVDEYLSFLPDPNTRLGYKLVKADPIKAMELMKGTAPRDFTSSLQGMILSAFKMASSFPEMLALDRRGFLGSYERVGAIHAGLHDVKMDLGGIDSDELITLQQEAGAIIDEQVNQLVAFLREQHGEDMEVPVISVPTLFHKSRGKFAALTPGVANMVVLRKHLIIPDPLVPEFQADLKQSLPAAGFKPPVPPGRRGPAPPGDAPGQVPQAARGQDEPEAAAGPEGHAGAAGSGRGLASDPAWTPARWAGVPRVRVDMLHWGRCERSPWSWPCWSSAAEIHHLRPRLPRRRLRPTRRSWPGRRSRRPGRGSPACTRGTTPGPTSPCGSTRPS